MLLGAIDQRGSNISEVKWAASGRTYYFDLHPFPLEAEKLDFVFAVHYPVRLEFTAKPRLVPAHKP